MPRVPIPLVGPRQRRIVDPLQVDLVEYIEAHPPAAPAEPPAVVAHPMPAGLPALRISVADPDDMPEYEIPSRPASRTENAAARPVPRMPTLDEIVHLAQACLGRQWMAPAAKTVRVSERQFRRWRAGESRPSAVHLDRMRDEAEAHYAKMTDALRLSGRLPPAEAPVSEAANAPHVRDRKAIAEALARDVELRLAARVERSKAARKGARVDNP